MALGDDDKANIEQTIDDEVLKGTAIAFELRLSVKADAGDRLECLRATSSSAGATSPVVFELVAGLRRPRHGLPLTVKQTDWGIKPYSALFGTLKVSRRGARWGSTGGSKQGAF